MLQDLEVLVNPRKILLPLTEIRNRRCWLLSYAGKFRRIQTNQMVFHLHRLVPMQDYCYTLFVIEMVYHLESMCVSGCTSGHRRRKAG